MMGAPPIQIIDLWGPILFAQNIMGYALTLFAYVKGHFFPTHAGDVKLSGSFLYDLLMGVEFNPRIGRWFDFKVSSHHSRRRVCGPSLKIRGRAHDMWELLRYELQFCLTPVPRLLHFV